MENELKKVDGRSNNGGHSTKGRAGRPPKAREKKITNFALGAMKKAFGSEEKAWIELAKEAKNGSFPHLRLMFEYKYGKPKEQKDVNVKTDVNIPIISFMEKDNSIDITHTEDE